MLLLLLCVCVFYWFTVRGCTRVATTRTLTLGQLRAHAHTRFSRRGALQHHFFTFFPFLLHLNWIDFLSSFLATMIVSISFNLLGSTLLLTGRRRPRRSVDFYLLVFADLVFRSPQIVLIHSSAQETRKMLVLFFLAVDFSTLTQTVETFPPCTTIVALSPAQFFPLKLSRQEHFSLLGSLSLSA